MGGKNTSQNRSDQKRSQSGMSQGNRPFPGGIDKEERKGRHAGEGERQSGSESTKRATQGQDMARGSGGKVNDSRRPDNREKEDVDSDERKTSRDRERKDSSH